MNIDRDLINLVIVSLLGILGYVIRLARESIAALGARVGELEQARAVASSQYDTVLKHLERQQENERATAEMFGELHRMMGDIKIEIAKLTAKESR
jgi:hypothetical protein